MARRYIVATKVTKLNEDAQKTYYKYFGEEDYQFNRSIIISNDQSQILRGFQEIYRHGFKSYKDASEYLQGKQEADKEFTDSGTYKKESSLLSFYFAPRHG